MLDSPRQAWFAAQNAGLSNTSFSESGVDAGKLSLARGYRWCLHRCVEFTALLVYGNDLPLFAVMTYLCLPQWPTLVYWYDLPCVL